MQTVCTQKYFGAFTEEASICRRAFSSLKVMPRHERLLGLQLFVGGLVISGLMLAAVSALGL